MVGSWRASRPDLDVTPLLVTGRILRAARLIQKRLDEVASRHGLSHKGDLDVLTHLRRIGPPHQADPSGLARSGLITTAGMTARLDRLEAAGLLARSPHPVDRRSVIITATPLGLTVADAAFADILEVQGALTQALDARASAQVAAALRRLLIELGDTD